MPDRGLHEPGPFETSVMIRDRNDLDKVTTATLMVRVLPVSARVKHAAKVLGIVWGVAVACVFIPVFHFVLVPLGILVGGVFAFHSFALRLGVNEGEVVCPRCSARLRIEPREFNWPLRLVCKSCHGDLTLQLTN